MLHKSIFNINESPFFKGYTVGQHWNGWACPEFEKAEAEAIAEYIAKESDEYQKIVYNADTDAFTCTFGDEDQSYSWQGIDIETEDGIKHLYDIGAFSWIWDDAEYLWTPEEMVQYYLTNFTDWGN